MWSDRSWPGFVEWSDWSGYAAHVYRYARAIQEMALECLVLRHLYIEGTQTDTQGMEAEERLEALLSVEKRPLVGD